MDNISLSEIPLPGENISYKNDNINVQLVGDSSENKYDSKSVTEYNLIENLKQESTTNEFNLNNFVTDDSITINDNVDNQSIQEESSHVGDESVNNTESNLNVIKPENVSEELQVVEACLVNITNVEDCVMEGDNIVKVNTIATGNDSKILIIDGIGDVSVKFNNENENSLTYTEENSNLNRKDFGKVLDIRQSIEVNEIGIVNKNNTVEDIKNEWTDSLTDENDDEFKKVSDKQNDSVDSNQMINLTEVSQEKLILEEDSDTVEESIPETLQEDIPETLQETVPETLQETVPETVEEAVQKTVQESIQEIVQEAVQETVQEAVQETVQESIKKEETVQKTFQEIIKKTSQEYDQKITEKEKCNDVHKETVEQNELLKDIEKNSKDKIDNTNVENEVVVSTASKTPEVSGKNKPSTSTSGKRNVQTRSSDKLQIPCHVFGRNVDNPTEDLISNGRTPPKPRLGVKVPYRFLTSQIVSKQDIANELIEITSKRNPAPDPPAGGDIFFASKLTQRLASKIAESESKRKNQSNSPSTSSSVTTTTQIDNTKTKTAEISSGIPAEALTTTSTDASNSKQVQNVTIGDNSDLLAILEGAVDVDLTEEVRTTSVNRKSLINIKTNSNNDLPVKMDPEMEKKIALKQLRELPKKETRGRPRKYTYYDSPPRNLYNLKSKLPGKSTINKTPYETEVDEVSIPKLNAETKEVNKIIVNQKNIENQNKSSELTPENELAEPHTLTPKRVTKTYSRKEAVLDVPAELEYIVNELEPQGSATENSSKVNLEESNSNSEEIKKKEISEDLKKSNKTTKQEDLSQNNKKIENNQNNHDKKTKQIKRSFSEAMKPQFSKPARVIKRKVIWDPAEIPKTKVLNAIRKAHDLELKMKKNDKERSLSESEDKIEENKEINKVRIKTKEIKTQNRKAPIRKIKKIVLKKNIRLPRSVKEGKLKKKHLIASISKKIKPKKTELDKLLEDEGAVNMLYSVRQTKLINTKTLSQKELQNRTKVVKEVITESSSQVDRQKHLRKKDGLNLSISQTPGLPPRKKSGDSIRSSLQSPPPSPSYMYPQRAEASRIIRRHSSSFSSDCSTPLRLSVDCQQGGTETNNPVKADLIDVIDLTSSSISPLRRTRRKTVPIYERKSEEKTYKGKRKLLADKTPSPENTSASASCADSVSDERLKSKMDKMSIAEKRKLSNEMSKNFSKTPLKKRTRRSKGDTEEIQENEPKEDDTKIAKTTKVDKKEKLPNMQDDNSISTEYKEVNMKFSDKLVQIWLTPTNSKLKNTMNKQMLIELTDIINSFADNDECHAIIITSTNNSFCHGIDFSELIQSNLSKRQSIAREMADALKGYISALATFPKPIIAGVRGSAVGLGVTMLPLFDLVFASDKATFSTPYGRLGQIPEGAAFLTLPSLLGNALTSELFYANRKLTASEAVHHGLITKVLWPDKFKEELVLHALSVCDQSLQSMKATKSLLRQSLCSQLDQALETEHKMLIEHWISRECQTNFKDLLEEDEWW